MALLRPSLSPHSTPLSVLVQAPKQGMMADVLQSLAASLGLHYYPLSLYDIVSSSPPTPPHGQSSWTVPYGWVMAAVTACAPCLIHLTDVSALTKLPSHLPSPLPVLRLLLASALTVADVPSYDATPPALKPLFTHQYDATAFPRESRSAVVAETLAWVGGVGPAEAQDMARVIGEKTAGVSIGEVVAVVKEGVRLGRRRWVEEETKRRAAVQQRLRLSGAPSPAAAVPAPLILEPFSLTLTDLQAALSALTARSAAQAGTIASTPTTRWSDIGGLETAKREINDIIQLPLLHPSLFSSPSSSPTSSTKRRGGLLLYGPPGTGKTLLAKAVACESGLNFISVKGPELLNMYVGESERNVRDVFHRARAARPCVVFFDELDSLAPRRGGGSDGGGVMDRVVSQLLTEMDDLAVAGGGPSESIFIIGATNRPDLLDAALLRPGRLDRAVYLGVGEGEEGRLAILRALTRKLRLQAGGDWLREVVAGMEGRGFTGADCYGLVMDALMIGVKRRIEEVRVRVTELNLLQRQMYQDAREVKGEEGEDEEEDEEEEEEGEVTALSYLRSLKEEELEVEVTREDFLQALQHLVPSLSKEELDHYETLRRRFSKEPTTSNTSTASPAVEPKQLITDKLREEGRGPATPLSLLPSGLTGKEEADERKEGDSFPHPTPPTNDVDAMRARPGGRRPGRRGR